jgi:hypothetical protein
MKMGFDMLASWGSLCHFQDRITLHVDPWSNPQAVAVFVSDSLLTVVSLHTIRLNLQVDYSASDDKPHVARRHTATWTAHKASPNGGRIVSRSWLSISSRATWRTLAFTRLTPDGAVLDCNCTSGRTQEKCYSISAINLDTVSFVYNIQHISCFSASESNPQTDSYRGLVALVATQLLVLLRH